MILFVPKDISVRLKAEVFMEADAGGIVRPDLLLDDPISSLGRDFHHQRHCGGSGALSSLPRKDFRPDGRAAWGKPE